ncbi:uncharacterized protein LACBIDRAFT_296890 [Laccaria bicolor S238N-H82]|uniref:Predicted protein n=1 Tax=Laccaria bicolor (strain S238N-H82 / ATCC MYA-4686) TaxID=486041 RepID=B0D9I1_LACBS|nr:uncharacterized protein LACBIDRAFT_296890 [Laccaria bicolor S238N-H82]EDR08584.1 predicted protein [Laccaria bicolor S238N-H82]|eukprot:XP_001880809.1 predicted protein [Laccaria bicolor S238N-H82]
MQSDLITLYTKVVANRTQKGWPLNFEKIHFVHCTCMIALCMYLHIGMVYGSDGWGQGLVGYKSSEKALRRGQHE